MFRVERGRKGFTLIELLVVIAIIAILAAILFPVFARARRAAQKTACLSNVKQIGIGINMYIQDWDNKLPYSQFGGKPSPTAGATWGTPPPPLKKYAADGVTLEDVLPPGISFQNAVTSYVKNTKIFECPASSSGYVYNLYSSSLLAPAGSHKYNGGQSAEKCIDSTLAPIIWDDKTDAAFQAHDDSVNVLYMDYHASSVSLALGDYFWDKKSAEGWY